MVSSFILLIAHVPLLPEKWCFILFKFVSKKIGCSMRPSFTDHISHMSERSALFCWKYIVVFIFLKLYYLCFNAKPLYWTFQVVSQLWNTCIDHRVVNDQINIIKLNVGIRRISLYNVCITERKVLNLCAQKLFWLSGSPSCSNMHKNWKRFVEFLVY